MKKYKADFKRKMTFHEVISKFNTDSKYITCTHNAMITSNQLFETRIISFNIFGEIFIDGKFDDSIGFQELIKSDWYQVHEVKEENPIQGLNRMNSRQAEIFKDSMKELNNRRIIIGTTDITEDIAEICREEIAKSQTIDFDRYDYENEKRMVFDSIKKSPLNDAYNMDVFESIMKQKGMDIYGRKLKKKQPKKPKQSFDGKLKVYKFIQGGKLNLVCLDKEPVDKENYTIATQKDINNFFSGTKDRIKIKQLVSEEYYELNGKTYHCKLGFKDAKMYYKRNISNGYMQSISKEEYLEGLKK